MMNFIPIFPLNIVVFPGENLNLHVFEPRYIQLINECRQEQKPFGIPVTRGGALLEYGTLMEIGEIVKVYKNGKLNIRIKGQRIFRVLEVTGLLPEKLFEGAIVEYPENDIIKISPETEMLIINEVKRLYRLLHLEKKFPEMKKTWKSYDIAHKVGLSLEEEYEFLKLFNEVQRMEFLRRHLNKMLPVVMELENMKKRIQMNGHFRKLS